MSTNNSDRLRGLHHQGTPEEPRQRVPEEPVHRPPVPPKASNSNQAGPIAHPSNTTGSSKSRTLLIVVVTGVLALALTVLVFALALQIRDSVSSSGDSGTVTDTEVANEKQEINTPSGASAFDRPSNVPELITQVTASTVVIVCERTEELGSGFVFDLGSLADFSSRVVVTNHHVVVGCLDSGQVDVYQADNRYVGEIEGWDKSSDLAVVSVPGLRAPALEPNFNPQIGQWVMAVGAPIGIENSVSFGSITNILNDEPTITSDAIIAVGSSGGPLVDNQGRVLAVNYAVWEDATGISLSAPIVALCLETVECR